MILFIAFQLALAVPRPLAPKDSAKLIARVRDAEFSYIMDWRHEWEMWRSDLAIVSRMAPTGSFGSETPPIILARVVGAPQSGRASACPPMTNGKPVAVAPLHSDVDQHDGLARFIKGGDRSGYFCADWITPFRTELWKEVEGIVDDHGLPADEALGIDTPLPPEYRDTVRARRVPLLRLLDSAATQLPGDAWLAGQRVRMHVDQQETALALRVATECRAAAWWCGMLRGYAELTAHDTRAAAATFDTALARMPADTACRWNDLSELLIYSVGVAYEKSSCAEQASVNARIWWLGDPLYLVPTNDRRTEHYARLVLATLHRADDADEREDMRDSHMGLALEALVVRYGWPSAVLWTPPPINCPKPRPLQPNPPCGHPVPPGWSRFDSHSVDLSVSARVSAQQPGTPTFPLYWGPQYHTIPSWSAITDPLHSEITDWDLGPEQLDSLLWDTSWWAPEFYQRAEGPLVGLSTQIGFLRRHSTAVIAAAMEWPTATTLLAPPSHASLGVITSGGPDEKPRIAGLEMDGAHPRAILTPVESRPLLLGVEMVPANDSGAAARTRFGIAPPQPLTALAPGTLALSDVLLARATLDDSFPTSIQETLPRMYGSTTLVNPTRLAIFWEVYGQGDGDTVDVSIRIVRRSDAGRLARAAAALGIGHAGDDTVVVQWKEPRPHDPLAFTDSGASIRPRGFALDVSGLSAGEYTLSVRADRRDASASSAPRELTIVRR